MGAPSGMTSQPCPSDPDALLIYPVFIKLAENAEYKVKIHDPLVKRFAYKLYPLEEAVRDSDCLVLITDHSQFRQIDAQKVSALVRNKNLVDTRNILEHHKWEEAGFKIKVLGDGTR